MTHTGPCLRARPVAALLVVLAAHGLGACALPGAKPPPTASAEERAAFDAAMSTRVSDPEATRQALRAYLETYPEGPLSDDAAYLLGELALDRGDLPGARGWFETVLDRTPGGDRVPDAHLQLARLALDAGDPDGARSHLSRLRPSRLDPTRQRQLLRLQADAAGEAVERLRYLASLRAASLEAEGAGAESVAVIDREIEGLLPTMSAEDLERAAEQLGGRSPAGRVWLALAAQAMVEDDLETAEEALARLRNIALPESALAEVEDLARQLALRERVQTVGLPTFRDLAALPVPSTMGAEATLGVVLPLSGDFAEFGERCLQGVLLAARLFEEADSDPYRLEDDAAGEDGPWVRGGSLESRVRLLVRDSGGDPERAAAAVRELAERSDVDAIVGPLLSGEAEAAAAAAEAEEVPLVALSLRDEVAQGRPYVFRIRTTPRDEVASLVEHAVTALEARRFAILYPATRYGRGSREAFWRAVDEAGGDVVAVASYDPDATDFADPIRSLIGYGLLTDREKRALRERQEALDRVRRFAPEDQAIARALLRWLPGPEGQPLPPVVDFDVLFIPDAADNVALIAPQLAFHEVGGVRLLGTGDWLDPELLRIGRGHVGGAVIAAPFHVESRFAFVSRFVEDFHATFGGDPDPLAAHAYDAAQLVLLQALAGREDRDDLRDGLLATHGYPGVSGVITMLPDGNARKRPYLLGVQGGGFVSLD